VTRSLWILAEAEAELTAAAEWYETRRKGLGLELMATVDAALGHILDSPASCPLWKPGFPYRKLALRRFPFVIFYMLSETAIEITAIAHAKRDAGYWVTRKRT
jgi:toxin ParE1/3/4